MKNIIIFTFVLVVFSLEGKCQSICRSVIGSDGGFTTNATTRLQFTVGEAVVMFLKAGGNQLSEGYQQDDSACITLDLKDFILPIYNLTLSPNPANHVVKLKYSIPYNCTVNCNIYDCLGRLCLRYNSGLHVSGNNEDEIDLSNIVSGTYILRVTYLSDDMNCMKSFPLLITK